MEKRALKEAECWLISAENTLELTSYEERFTVASAQSIHAVIRANDALTQKYLRRVAERHERAIGLFQDLIRQNKLPQDEAKMVDILVRAVHRKSNFDYKGGSASRADAEKWIYEAKKFLAMAGKYA
jgi:uncharacterized protein (UPF0332 family)